MLSSSEPQTFDAGRHDGVFGASARGGSGHGEVSGGRDAQRLGAGGARSSRRGGRGHDDVRHGRGWRRSAVVGGPSGQVGGQGGGGRRRRLEEWHVREAKVLVEEGGGQRVLLQREEPQLRKGRSVGVVVARQGPAHHPVSLLGTRLQTCQSKHISRSFL